MTDKTMCIKHEVPWRIVCIVGQYLYFYDAFVINNSFRFNRVRKVHSG